MSSVSDGVVQPAIPNHKSGARIPEYVVRQFLQYALEEVSRNVDTSDFLDELFSLHKPSVINEIKTYFREHKNIDVSVNFPRRDKALPFLAVVNVAENEDAGHAYLGDFQGTAQFGVLGGDGETPTSHRDQEGTMLKCETLIVIAADEPDLALFLYHVVRHLMFANKMDFLQYADMHNLMINGQDLQWSPELRSEFAYMKSITLIYDTFFDVNRSAVSSIAATLTGLFADTDLDITGVSLSAEPTTTAVMPSEYDEDYPNG